MQIVGSTISGNSANGGGGGNGGFGTGVSEGGSSAGAGIFVVKGNINLTNGTLFSNMATGGKGGFVHNRGITLSRLGQGGDDAGGGLYLSGGSVSLTALTIASNQALVPPNTAQTGVPLGADALT